MLSLKFKLGEHNKKETIFLNPACGHEQKFDYSAPIMCQHINCTEVLPKVHLLIGVGEEKRDRRVEFFAEGKI